MKSWASRGGVLWVMVCLTVASGLNRSVAGPVPVTLLQGLARAPLAGAATAPVAPETLQIPANAIEPGADVGYLPGQWTVDDTGAFAYTIALDVPDGHLTPSLALTYSSSSRSNGELGVGWRLQGASAITRCGQNLTVDGAVAAEGRYCLDGEKLIAVPGAPGAMPGVYGASGTQYRTEIAPYARISTLGMAAGAPERFRVELRSGRVREYRAVKVPVQSGTLSSVIAPAGAPGNAPLSDAPTDYAVGKDIADRWVLETETDASGNQLRYDWSDQMPGAIDPVTHGLDLRLLQIRYGRDDSPLEFRKVTLEYEARADDDDFVWARGVRSQLRQRLKSITAHAPSPRTMVPVWRYTLGYAPSMSRSGRSLLAWVQKCGLAGAPTAGEGMGPSEGGCLWKKTFAWADQQPGASELPKFTTQTVKSFADPITWPVFDAADPLSWANQITALVHPPVAHVLDLDGDGTDDLVLQASSGVEGLPTHIFRGQRQTDGSAKALSQYTFFDGAMQPNGRGDRVLLQTARAVDLDNSGRDQLLTVRQLRNLDSVGNPDQGWTYEYKLFGWGPNGFGPSDQAALLDIDHLTPKRFNFLDLDGDRRLDMLVEGSGADAGQGPAFFWWNKTWEVWRNLGGTLVKTAMVPLETKCPSYVTDADGDGRGEFVQLYDHDEVIGQYVADANGNPSAIAWASPNYDADAQLPGYRQYECTALGYVSMDAAGQAQVSKLAAALAAPISGAGAARANNVYFQRHRTPQYVFGDFNADGLDDEFSTQLDAQGQALNAWVRWNTGKGYGPRVAVAGFFPLGLDATWQVRNLVGDLDGDGDDDLVSLRRPDGNGQPTLILALSDGHGDFKQSALPGGAGLFDELETYITTRLGDFDGDGRPDLVGFTDPQTLVLRLQQPQYNERMTAIADEPTPWPRLAVVYGNQASDKPEPVQACAYPLSCVRRGSTVVRRVLSREHLVDPTAAQLADTNARTFDYSYEDPVVHLRGRGRLGYRKVRQWEARRPMETVTEYDNRTEVGKGYFPGVSMPIRVTTVVPFALADGSDAPPESTAHARPAKMVARVTRTQTVAQVQALNKLQPGDAWGLTYDVHAQQQITEEWEQAVTIDWSLATSEHLASADPGMKRLYSDDIPASVLRTSVASAVYDEFGNQTDVSQEVLGAASIQIDRQFTNTTQPAWRIGQLYHQKITRNDGATTAVNEAEFYYDDKSRLIDVHRDKGHADADVPVATHLSYDVWGNVTSVQVTARNQAGWLETRQSRMEYAPPVTGWADEHLYPSQVWSPGVPGYQPSTWLAIHPAYGLPLATMSVNGVQAQRRYDDLGRLVWSRADGAAAGTLAYQGRPDNGGYNGLLVRSAILHPGGAPQTAHVELDAVGRPLREVDLAFDGSERVVERRYDSLDRLAAVSRPFAQAGLPGAFTTWQYDALDRPLKVTAPDGSTVRYEYPDAFQTRTFDADQHESIVMRDLLGRTVRSQNMLEGKPITTTFAYGVHGLVDTVDPAGHRTHTQYDAVGRPVLQEAPDTGRTLLAYTGFGELRESRHPKSGEGLTREYDALGRITRQSEPGVTQFLYDSAAHGLGQLAQAQSPDKVISSFRYDEVSGRLASMGQWVDGVEDRVDLHFDTDNGRLLQLDMSSFADKTTVGLTLHYGYNDAGFADTVATQAAGQPPQTVWRVTARNLDHALLTATQGNNGMLDVQRHYVAQNGRLDAMSVLQGNQALLSLGYGYYASGLMKTRDDKLVQRQEGFTYDSLLRLQHAGLTHAGVVHNTYYDYDATGNLMRVDGEQHLIGQQVPPLINRELNLYGTTDPVFPQPHTLTSHLENGNSELYSYDARGRRIDGGGLAVPSFTAGDLPRSVIKAGQTWQYRYDAFGNKVQQTAPDGSATTYVADLYERTTRPGQETTHVFHVAGTDGAVADLVHSTSQPGTFVPHYLLEDALGSVSVVLDGAGSVERRHYDPFGKRVNPDGSAYAGPAGVIAAGFTGHLHQAALGLIDMRGRLYDPALKRFLSPDPLVAHPAFGQSWNPYSYVLNSPLNFTDPSGYRDEAQICTDLDDQSVCYPSTGSGGTAPGTDDFNACSDCNQNGSANDPYGVNLNGGPSGPGFFNSGPRDGASYGTDGQSGSKVAKSSVEGQTKVAFDYGGSADAIRRRCDQKVFFSNMHPRSGKRIALWDCAGSQEPSSDIAMDGYFRAIGLGKKSKLFSLVFRALTAAGVPLVETMKPEDFIGRYSPDGRITLNVQFLIENRMTEYGVAVALLHEGVHALSEKSGVTSFAGSGWGLVANHYFSELLAFALQWWGVAELVNAGELPGSAELWTNDARAFFAAVKAVDSPHASKRDVQAALALVAGLAMQEISFRPFYFFKFVELLVENTGTPVK